MSEETTTTANAGDSPNQAVAQGQSFSQEDVDRIVNDRLARERKKFEGFDDIKAKAEKFDAVASERDALAEKVNEFEAQAERSKIASEVAKDAGVPAEALRGSTREELEAHAEVLKALIKPSGPIIPSQEKSPSHVGADPLREFARGLFEQAKNQ